MNTVEIPGLGLFAEGKYGAYISPPLNIAMLGEKKCRFILEDYHPADPRRDDFRQAISNLLSLSPKALETVNSYVFQYYKDCVKEDQTLGLKNPVIDGPDEIWASVDFGTELLVMRRSLTDPSIYIYVECECSWETEHGLGVVFKEGLQVSKIGPCDGLLSHADVWDDMSHKDTIYVRH
ncbi:MAG: hypothetical protein AAGJ10_19940 [Bacteroidota bacterium]